MLIVRLVSLGGYCKIAGMVDESMDPAVLNSEPQAWEYRSRPAWQRLFIITGGVLMNFITAIVLYGVLLFTWGQEQLPVQNAYLGYDYCETALKNGFQNGDIVLAVNGEAVHLEKDALEKIVIEGKQNVMVRRDSADTLIVLPKDFGEQMLAAEEKEFMAVRVPFVIDQVAGDSPAAAAGLQAGDSVVGLNGKAIAVFQDISKELELCKSQRVALSVMRGDILVNDSITVNEDGKMGVQLRNPMPYFKTEKEAFGFFEAIPAGWHMMTDVLTNELSRVPRTSSRLIRMTMPMAGRLMMPPSQGQAVKACGSSIPIFCRNTTRYRLQLILTVVAATVYSRTRSHPIIQAMSSPIVAYE
jgi:regulator of sigma E protease